MGTLPLSRSHDEAEQPGSREALLLALRHVAEAKGMARVARKAGVQRESLYRALSPKGNPTIKTLLAVMQATGLKLGVHRG
ncbi:MAG: putative addiction module antidote protein [Proteobacteria bacterium]|nr:putative addiction module antidote protein [Pseudomonadota bacterium]